MERVLFIKQGGWGQVDEVVKHFGKFHLFFLAYKRVTLALLLLFTR